MIIDAKDLILGRLATVAAKQALLGEEIIIINAEKAVISGNKANIFKKYYWRDNLGYALKGPYLPKTPYMFVKRVIRGMLPYKNYRGKEALKRIKCYPGNPSNVKGETIKNAQYSNLKKIKFVTVAEVCKHLKK